MLAADANKTDNIGYTPLIVASTSGHVDVVTALLANEKSNPNQALYNGRSPLYIAAKEGHSGIVKILLEKGAAVDERARNDTTPLYAAAQRGHLEVVKDLLKRGANINSAVI